MPEAMDPDAALAKAIEAVKMLADMTGDARSELSELLAAVSPPPGDQDGRPVTAAPPVTGPEDVTHGLRFVHLMAVQSQARVAELSASFYALLETLIGEGLVPVDKYEKRREGTIARENERAEGAANIEIADVADKYTLEGLPEVDCAERMPICKARCCRLSFALSVQDLNERVVRWNYGQPYRIAQTNEGRCVHCSPSGRCDVYEQRPAVCRGYSCADDDRIWKDFEQRILAD